MRLGVVTEGLGEGVGAQAVVVEALEAAVERLRGLGAEVVERSLPEHLQAGGIAFAGFVEGVTALFREEVTASTMRAAKSRSSPLPSARALPSAATRYRRR